MAGMGEKVKEKKVMGNDNRKEDISNTLQSNFSVLMFYINRKSF